MATIVEWIKFFERAEGNELCEWDFALDALPKKIFKEFEGLGTIHKMIKTTIDARIEKRAKEMGVQ